jgi:hypothetical protein
MIHINEIMSDSMKNQNLFDLKNEICVLITDKKKKKI